MPPAASGQGLAPRRPGARGASAGGPATALARSSALRSSVGSVRPSAGVFGVGVGAAGLAAAGAEAGAVAAAGGGPAGGAVTGCGPGVAALGSAVGASRGRTWVCSTCGAGAIRTVDGASDGSNIVAWCAGPAAGSISWVVSQRSAAPAAGGPVTGAGRQASSASRSAATLCGRLAGRGCSIQSMHCRKAGEQPGRACVASGSSSSTTVRVVAGAGARPSSRWRRVAPSAYRSVHGPCLTAPVSPYCSIGA